MALFESGLVKAVVRKTTPNTTGIKIYVKDTVVANLFPVPAVSSPNNVDYKLDLILASPVKIKTRHIRFIADIYENIKDIVIVARNIGFHFNCSVNIPHTFDVIEDRKEMFFPVIDNVEIIRNGIRFITIMNVDEAQKYYDATGTAIKIYAGVVQRIPSDVPCNVEIMNDTQKLLFMPNKNEDFDLRNTTLNFDFAHNLERMVIGFERRNNGFDVNHYAPRNINMEFVGTETASLKMPNFYFPSIEISGSDIDERVVNFDVSDTAVMNLERLDDILSKFRIGNANKLGIQCRNSSTYKIRELIRLAITDEYYFNGYVEPRELFKRISHSDFVEYLEALIDVLSNNNMRDEARYINDNMDLMKSDEMKKYAGEVRSKI